jgi:hypothetical protein
MLPDGNEVGGGVVGGKGDIVVWLVVSPLFFGGDGIAGLGSDGSASEGI